MMLEPWTAPQELDFFFLTFGRRFIHLQGFHTPICPCSTSFSVHLPLSAADGLWQCSPRNTLLCWTWGRESVRTRRSVWGCKYWISRYPVVALPSETIFLARHWAWNTLRTDAGFPIGQHKVVAGVVIAAAFPYQFLSVSCVTGSCPLFTLYLIA